jgi:hypothetical protein
MRKHARVLKEAESQNILNTFLGTANDASQKDEVQTDNEKKQHARNEAYLISGMHKLKADEVMKEVLSEASDLEKLGALRVKQPTWNGKSTIEREALQRLGFLFSTYKCKFWYWEAWETLRKLLLSSVLLFVWDGTPGQVCAGFLIATWSLILALNWQPHCVLELQATYSYTLLVEAVTHLSGLMLITSGFQDIVGTDDVNEKFIMGVVLIILHVASFLVPVIMYTGLYVAPNVHVRWPQWLTCCRGSHQDTSWRYAYEEDLSVDLSISSHSVVCGEVGFEDHLAGGRSAIQNTTFTVGIQRGRDEEVLQDSETTYMSSQNATAKLVLNSRLGALRLLSESNNNSSNSQQAPRAANFRSALKQKGKDPSMFDEDSPLVFV